MRPAQGPDTITSTRASRGAGVRGGPRRDRPSPSDRRRALVSLTPLGRGVARRAPTHGGVALGRALTGWDDARAARLAAELIALAAALDAVPRRRRS